MCKMFTDARWEFDENMNPLLGRTPVLYKFIHEESFCGELKGKNMAQ